MKKFIGLLVVAPLFLLGAGGQGPSLVQTEIVKKAQVKSLQTFVGSVVYEQSSKVHLKEVVQLFQLILKRAIK